MTRPRPHGRSALFGVLRRALAPLALTLIPAVAPSPRLAHAQFVDITDQALIHFDQGPGVAWGDMNQDGVQDLFLARRPFFPAYTAHRGIVGGPAGVIYLEDWLFEVIDTPQMMAGAWADIDNDGDLDLYVANQNEPNKLLRNDGGGVFADVTTPVLAAVGFFYAVTWTDYDRDGDVDLFAARHASPSSSVLLRNDAGTFVDASAALPNNLGGRGAAWGDYDGDDDPDLYVASMNADALYRNDGGTFVNVIGGPLVPNGRDFGAAWGDYDNDGDLDLFRSTGVVPSKLFRNDGGAFVDVTSGDLAGAGEGAVAWGDYDNDGDLDLFVGASGGLSRLFRNDGGGAFANVTASPLGVTPFLSGAWADVDLDGDLDLVAGDIGNVKLFRNDLANGNRWLHLNLVGVVSNRSAIGARARVVAGGVTRIREVEGGSGVLSQNSLPLEFGLGSATIIDSVVIRWPSGIVQAITPPPVDRRWTIIEGVPLGVEIRDPAGASLTGATPNPFRESTRVAWTLAIPADVSLAVYDLQGRSVMTLASSAMGAGRHAVVWDGRAADGRSQPAGLYVVRLTGEVAGGRRFEVSRRILRLR